MARRIPHNTSRPFGPAAGARGAFTLIELLIVIGIIAVLVALAVVVGAKVVEGGRARATTDVIRVLDGTLASWQFNARTPLPSVLEVKEDATRSRYFPIIDARRPSGNSDFAAEAEPSALYYSALVMQDQSVAPEFEQLDSAFVSSASAPQENSQNGRRESWAIPAADLRDAWGRPMRFVHPAFHGGHGEYWDGENERMANRDPMRVMVKNPQGREIEVEYRRSYRPFEADAAGRKATWVGDADEGMAVGGRGYFYSAGEDGDPGTRADNVYSTEPRFPVETRDFD
ncbi:MAG: type II secretion system protein [Phycisphaerales bacterium JB054]